MLKNGEDGNFTLSVFYRSKINVLEGEGLPQRLDCWEVESRKHLSAAVTANSPSLARYETLTFIRFYQTVFSWYHLRLVFH